MVKNEIRPWFWFIGGLFAGLALVGVTHAAVPEAGASAPVIRELKGGKARLPSHLDREFESLSRVESRFVESPELVSRLKKGSYPNARRANRGMNSGVRK